MRSLRVEASVSSKLFTIDCSSPTCNTTPHCQTLTSRTRHCDVSAQQEADDRRRAAEMSPNQRVFLSTESECHRGKCHSRRGWSRSLCKPQLLQRQTHYQCHSNTYLTTCYDNPQNTHITDNTVTSQHAPLIVMTSARTIAFRSSPACRRRGAPATSDRCRRSTDAASCDAMT